VEESQFQETLLRRLNTVISLLVEERSAHEAPAISEKIRHLVDMGLSPAEVGEIVGKPTNYVTAIMHRTKKTNKKARTNG
jgi:hypothetical protein